MKIDMYVISHKWFKKPKIDCYSSLLVGADFNKADLDLYDNVGDNISKKNKNYCELTGIYWIWKHSKADVVGVSHYRRYFSKSLFSTNEKYFLNCRDINKYFKNYDVIVPTKRYYKEKVIEAINIAPNMNDVIEMEKAISILEPDYLENFKKYLSGNECFLYNMCIMKKEIFDKYCQWLFNILFFIEKDYYVDNNDPYRSRLLGFLSERLIYVWLKNNVKSNRIKEVRVIKTDESFLWSVKENCKNMLRNLVFSIRNIF